MNSEPFLPMVTAMANPRHHEDNEGSVWRLPVGGFEDSPGLGKPVKQNANVNGGICLFPKWAFNFTGPHA
jgi:hypothetical protein